MFHLLPVVTDQVVRCLVLNVLVSVKWEGFIPQALPYSCMIVNAVKWSSSNRPIYVILICYQRLSTMNEIPRIPRRYQKVKWGIQANSTISYKIQ